MGSKTADRWGYTKLEVQNTISQGIVRRAARQISSSRDKFTTVGTSPFLLMSCAPCYTHALVKQMDCERFVYGPRRLRTTNNVEIEPEPHTTLAITLSTFDSHKICSDHTEKCRRCQRHDSLFRCILQDHKRSTSKEVALLHDRRPCVGPECSGNVAVGLCRPADSHKVGTTYAKLLSQRLVLTKTLTWLAKMRRFLTLSSKQRSRGHYSLAF